MSRPDLRDKRFELETYQLRLSEKKSFKKFILDKKWSKTHRSLTLFLSWQFPNFENCACQLQIRFLSKQKSSLRISEKVDLQEKNILRFSKPVSIW